MEIFSLVGSILLKDDNTKGKLQEIDSSASKLGGTFDSAFSKIASTALKVGGIIGAGLGFKAMFSAAEASQQKLAQMDSVLKSTGDASGMTKAQLLDLAAAQGKVTDFSKGTNIATENLLLTFTNIGSKVFPDALKSVNDMSQALGQDTSSSAIQLGKALNDPVKGITALSRVGVSFTEGQKAQIKAMVESGNVAGAQSIILKELQKEFGGSAEAAGKTFAGQLTILKNQISGVGGSIASLLMPSLTNFISKVNDNMPKIQATITNLINTTKPYITDIIKDVGQIASNLLPNLGSSTSNVGSIIAGVVKGGFTAFKDVLDWIAQHGTIVKAAIVGIGSAIATIKIGEGITSITKSISGTVATINSAGKAVKLLKAEGQSAGTIFKLLFGINPAALGLMVGITVISSAAYLVITHWTQVKTFFAGLWTSIKTIFAGIKTSIEGTWNSVKTTTISVLNSIKTTIISTWNNIKTAIVNNVKSTITELNNVIKQHQTAIKTTATILGTIFGPALIKSGVQAVTAGAKIGSSFIVSIVKAGIQAVTNGAKITASFVTSMVTAGAQAVANGAKVTASFVASMITTGAQAAVNGAKITASFVASMATAGFQATVNGAKIVASFVASLITTAAQAIATGAAITGSLISSVVSYAAEGWKAVASISAQTAAWLAQKAQVAASTVALVASKVATIASTGATTALTVAQRLLNAAMAANPIGLVITVLTGLAVALITAYNKSSTFRDGVNGAFKSVSDTVGSVVSWIKTKIHELADLPGEALKWGNDMISGFVDGIKSGFGPVGDAVGWVADKVSALLHHSTPDEGPLKNDDQWMPDFMQSMADGITNNSSLVTDALEKLTKKIKSKAQIKTPSISTVSNAEDDKQKLGNQDQAVNPISTLGSKASNAMTELASKFDQNGQQLNTNLGKGLSDSQDKATKPVDSLNTAITNKMGILVQSFINHGQNTDANLGSGITTNSDATLNPLTTLITTITTGIKTFVQACIGHGQDTDKNLGSGITNSSGEVVNAANGVTTTVGNNLNTFATGAIKYGQGTNASIASGVTGTVNAVTSAVSNLTTTIGNMLNTFASSCTTVGTAIGNSIADGMKSSESNVVDIAHELTQKVLDAFTSKEGFDIHSPSRKLFEIGQHAIQGFINGISSKDALSIFKSKIGSMLGAAGAIGGNVSEWLAMALGITGTDMGWLPGLLKLVSYESGDPGTLGSGDPSLVNSVGVNGEYATGLLQCLPSTFAEYMMNGFSNILNPIDNAIAAIRYIKSTYGSVYNTPLFRGGSYVGYEKGTDNATEGAHPVAESGFEIVLGKALKWFSGGETVLNNADSMNLLNNIKNAVETVKSLGSMSFSSMPAIKTQETKTTEDKNTNKEKQPIILKLVLQNGKELAEYMIDDINKLQGTMQLARNRVALGRR